MPSLPRFRRPERARPPAPAPPPPPLGADRSLLVRVRSRTAIAVRRRTQHLLDGEYGSIHRGRSMDFEDLRDYVVGDDVKDIDWKATARSGRPLVKRYVAERRHGVLLVVDTGRSMAALADPTNTKRDVVVLAAGVVGQIALRHGDSVGLAAGPVAGDAGGTSGVASIPFGRGDAHLEQILRTIDGAVAVDGPASDLPALLDHVAAHHRRRLIVVVLADDVDLTDRHRRRLRRLTAQHEVLYCAVGDVAVTEPALGTRRLRTVEGDRVPPFLRDRPRLHEGITALRAERAATTRATLLDCGATATRLDGQTSVVPTLLELLEDRRVAVSGARR